MNNFIVNEVQLFLTKDNIFYLIIMLKINFNWVLFCWLSILIDYGLNKYFSSCVCLFGWKLCSYWLQACRIFLNRRSIQNSGKIIYLLLLIFFIFFIISNSIYILIIFYVQIFTFVHYQDRCVVLIRIELVCWY